MKRTVMLTLALAAAAFVAACDSASDKTAQDQDIAAAKIASALTADPHDVAGFLYQITCDNGFSSTEYVPLQDGFMPTWVDSDAGEFHYFADLFSVTGVGHCTVTATPMQDPKTPSTECAPVSAEFDVLPGQTTEIVLMSQCEGDPTGAADIIAGLNDPPVIIDLTMDPDKFICLSDQEEGQLPISVTAEDPNGDALTYTWVVTSWPEMPAAGTYTINPANQPDVTFSASTIGPYLVTVTVTDTYGASTSLTFPIHVQDCDDTDSHEWQANFALDPNVECEDSKYLAIPSTNANKIAVYDLATLLPLPTSPWATCANPSRILMDANTDVVVTCRQDGKVNKHTRDGALLWSTSLPNCATPAFGGTGYGARGVVISPNGRLFAGCSRPAAVYELDPATGAILDTSVINSTVDYGLYGIVADSDGLYVCQMGDSKVTKLHLAAGVPALDPNDLSIEWTINQPCYGIAVDGAGSVWVSNADLRKFDTSNGALLATVPGTAGATGIMVSPSGHLYGGNDGLNQVVRVDLATNAATFLALGTPDHQPHGVTVDTMGNAYSINMSSSTLTKLDPAGVATSFGGTVVGDPTTTILQSPYGYSGDMTGAITQCLTSIQDTWNSGQVCASGASATWLTASWSATVPTGTSITFSYSLDGGPWTQFATALDTNQNGTYAFAPALVGHCLEFRALLSAPAGTVNMPALGNLSVTYN